MIKRPTAKTRREILKDLIAIVIMVYTCTRAMRVSRCNPKTFANEHNSIYIQLLIHICNIRYVALRYSRILLFEQPQSSC